jgi:tetratricopeptide (TPR) repeat protein
MKKNGNFSLIWMVIFFILFPLNIAASELDQTLKSFIENDDLEKARDFLVQYLESNPDDKEATFYLGKIHSDGDSSLKYLSEVIDLTDKGEISAEALLWMCKYSFLNGSYSITLEQTKEFEKKFDQSVFLPEILWLSGCSYLITGYREEAEQRFRMILEKFPQSEWVPWALLGLGDFFFLQKKFEQAIDQYSNLINSYGDSDALPLALISLCWCFIETKDPENALFYYNLYKDRYPSGILEQEKPLEKIRAELKEKIVKRKKTEYTIQVGVFSDKIQAEKAFKEFDSKGYTTRISEILEDQETRWSVEVGIFGSKKKAESFKNRIGKQFGKTYKVITR